MECLYCGKKLGVLRKLQSDEFCSAAHRKAYAKKQDDDALDFLLKSKPVLRPPVQPEPESLRPAPVEPKPLLVPAAFVPEPVAPQAVSALTIRNAQPVEPKRAAVLPAGAYPAAPRLLRAHRAPAGTIAHTAQAGGRKRPAKNDAPFEPVRPRVRAAIVRPIWIGAHRPAERKQSRGGFVATRPTWIDLAAHPLRAGVIAKFTMRPAIARANLAPRHPVFRLAAALRPSPQASVNPGNAIEHNGAAWQAFSADLHMQAAAASVRAAPTTPFATRLCGRIPAAPPPANPAPERAAAAIASVPVAMPHHPLLQTLEIIPRTLALSPAPRALSSSPQPAPPPTAGMMRTHATLFFKTTLHLGPFTRVGPIRPTFDSAQPTASIYSFAPEPRSWNTRWLARIWWSTPRWSRRLAVGVPVVAALIFGAGRLKTTLSVRNAQAAMVARIARRATVEVQDDFRSGLSRWMGAPNWAGTWSYDATGFARPGRLALLSSSIPMADYRLEFLAQIEKKALGWVYRAADTRNYYAMKLVVTSHGMGATYSIVHYAVIGGRQKLKVELPLPMTASSKTMLRVRQEIRNAQFTTYLDGRLVDTWSDSTLTHGGVGFFSDPGETAYVRWVDVAHNDDTLGRLCSYLAPRHTD